MSSVEVISGTQAISVETITQTITVPVQEIVVNTLTQETTVLSTPISIDLVQAAPSVSVTNNGPQGPRGYSSVPTNPAQAAFYEANGLEEKHIDYLDGLPSAVQYYENGVLIYESSITYVGGLPTLISLVRELDSQIFEKEITYLDGLPVSVEWRVV